MTRQRSLWPELGPQVAEMKLLASEARARSEEKFSAQCVGPGGYELLDIGYVCSDFMH